MDKVPKMISGKDLDYLSDMLNWNHVYCKTAKQHSNSSNDSEIKSILEELYNMHKTHYNILLGILQGGQNG